MFVLLVFLANRAIATADASSLNVAVAANFERPMEELAYIFEKKTTISLRPTYSATGKFYAQIKNGAPFDVFLAADCRRPDLLYKEGIAEKSIIYARGQAVLWTRIKGLCGEQSWQDVITKSSLKKKLVFQT